jgi:D-beta-D-heptose 7-phosphate kinase / D-beta-D-heptose 1-phosphate adenosyltransferase
MNKLSKNELLSVLNQLKNKTILVIGDIMLDQYIWGSVERISPEGPIPVLLVENEEFRLGGAANVAVNVKHLNCNAIPIGLIGKDHAGERITEIFENLSISSKGIFDSKTLQTIVKQRAITDQQQLLRIDYESIPVLNNGYHAELWSRIEKFLPDVDGIVISDYAKGVVSPDIVRKTIKAALENKIPVICDPGKGVDFSLYQGITVLKPNRFETEQATGITLKDKKSILKAAEKLQSTCQAQFVIVSLDKDGILYYQNSKEYQFIDSKVPEVYDVTGAGDSLISTLAVLLANSVSPLQSTYIANIAAGLETSHLGVVPVPWSEIQKHIAEDGLHRKITSLDQLLFEQDVNRDSPLVFTNGYFDNISAGHLKFLLEISKIPGKLIVAINSDACINRQKGSYPILKEQDRARLLASIENVHHVIVFDENDASSIIQSLKPDVVVKGEKFKGEKIPELDAISEVGAQIEYIPFFSW